MDFEVMEYFRRFAEGEFNLLHAGLVYLAGLGSVWLASRLLRSRVPLERPGALVLAAVAPFIGLVLTSTVYPCRGCNPPPGCDIVTVGVPIPQELRERDPARQTYGACWWSLTEASEWAVAGNFVLGTVGLPLIVTFFRPVRATEEEALAQRFSGRNPSG